MQSFKSLNPRFTLRSYVCVEGRLRYRIPDALHRAIMQGNAPLPQFANRELFVLEVARLTSQREISTRIVGTVYYFNALGLLEVGRYAELPSSLISASSAKSAKVVSLSHVFKHRSLHAALTWTPDIELKRAAEEDAVLPKSMVPSLRRDSAL